MKSKNSGAARGADLPLSSRIVHKTSSKKAKSHTCLAKLITDFVYPACKMAYKATAASKSGTKTKFAENEPML